MANLLILVRYKAHLPIDDKFKNKYRISSICAQWWDYGWDGAYFITICTQNQEHYFGEVVEGQFVPSSLGEIAAHIWHKIPDQFPYAGLGESVIMPNHIHGILILEKPDIVPSTINLATGDTKIGGFAGHKNPMINQNVSKIIRWYKGRCSFEMRKINTEFAWHSRFHDRIIRNYEEYLRISEYIIYNPQRWADDLFYREQS